jgi:hypothetical protein
LFSCLSFPFPVAVVVVVAPLSWNCLFLFTTVILSPAVVQSMALTTINWYHLDTSTRQQRGACHCLNVKNDVVQLFP